MSAIVSENISLKPHNSFNIDEPARYFVEVNSINELQKVLSDSRFKDIPFFVLGGGSNILFTKPFEGIVIKNAIMGIDVVKEDATNYYVKAGAGEMWHDVVMYCVNNNYGGLENLSLIPGNVGAGPIQNIGAYGVELKDCLYTVEAVNILDQSIKEFSNIQCKFGYRDSVFKKELKGKYIITAVTYKLDKQPQLNTSYGAIEKELEAQGVKQITIKDVSNAVCKIRGGKLPDPTDLGNAGSFFKNPEVACEKYESLKAIFDDIVAYPTTEGKMKLAAGWLIEYCGWKGKQIGDAGVHKMQALVLVNYGTATGKEIFQLSEKIIQDVKTTFGVELEREVNIL